MKILAIVISESAADKLSYYSISKCIVNINTNDILLNLYGDDENYKAFPDIGEVTEDQQLLARRRIIYDKILTDLKNLKDIRQNDDVFYLNGEVIDIKVYCNEDIDKLRDLPYYNQIVKYIDNDMEYYSNVVNELYDIVEGQTDLCSNNLIRYYNECKKRIDEGNYYTYQSNRFDNVMIEFTVMEEKKVKKGIKMTGRLTLPSLHTLVIMY